MMNTAFDRSTVFTIAHRISTIIDCDRVMVIKEGTNVEYDDPKLLTKNPNSEFSMLIDEKDAEEKEEAAKKAEKAVVDWE